MRLLTDSRAQSIQIGAVLLFGILIILLSTWQAFVIPDQNEEIEFNHNQEAQQQMTDLRSTVISMPGADTPQSSTVDLGLRYPSRTIFRNPPPVSGTIQTTETTDERYNVTISNAEPENDDLALLWNRDGSSYNTGEIEYRPRYNEYRNAPRTIFADSVLFNKFDREQQELPVTGQSLVRDDRISIIALNGSLSENRVDSTSVDFEPISTQTREVEIGSNEEQITIELPTRLNESRWERLLADEPNVESVTRDTDAFPDDDEIGLLEIELDADEEYRLQLAKVGVGTGATGTEAEYLTLLDRPDEEPITLEQGEQQEFTLEVRDEFNKALRGETVFADADNQDESNRSTREDGQVRFTYRAETVGSDTVKFSLEDATDVDSSLPEEIAVDIKVKQDDEQAAADPLDGPKAEELTYEEDEVTQGEPVVIDEARFNNTGTTDLNRGGVPVVAGEYYVVEGNVDEPSEGDLVKPEEADNPPADGSGLALDPIDSEDRALVLSTTGQIETDDLDAGEEYTAFIRGQDTRGIWTNESADGFLGEPFEVLEPDRELTLEARDDPIDPGDENVIDITLEDENEDPLSENITIELEQGSGSFTEIDSGDTVETDEDGEATVTYQSNEQDDAGETIIIRGEAVQDETVEDTAEFDVNEDETGSIEGTVTDEESDDSIEDASITIEDADTGDEVATTTTDDEGEYGVDNVPVGNYDVTADADGFGSETEEGISVEDDETTVVDFTLSAQTGTIEGTVTDDESGEPIEDATIAIEDSDTDEEVMTTSTDDQGEYSEEIQVGTYDVTAEADSFVTETSENNEVSEDETTTVDFELVREIQNLEIDVEPMAANTEAVHNWTFDGATLAEEPDIIQFEYEGDITFDPSQLDFDGEEPSQDDDVVVFLSDREDGDELVALNDISADNAAGILELELDGRFSRPTDGGGYVEIDGTDGGLTNPDAGTYDASMTFEALDDGTVVGTATGDVEYTVEPVTLTLEADQAEIDAGEQNQVTATYETESGDAIPDEDITFTVDQGDGIFVESDSNSVTVTTDSAGEATVTYDSVESDAGETVVIDGELADDPSINDSAQFDVRQPAGDTVVFTNAEGELFLGSQEDGATQTTSLEQNADAIAPLTTAFGEDPASVPYADGNELRLVDEDGGDQLLVDPSGPDGVNPKNEDTLITAGEWDGESAAVYFTGGDEEVLYRHIPGETPEGDAEEVQDLENEGGVAAIAGIGDVTGDGDDELVYLSTDDEIRYLDSPDSTSELISGVETSSSNSIGRPADFTGDGQAEIPIIDVNDNLALTDADGDIDIVLSSETGSPADAPIAPVDWDGDGSLDLVYYDNDDEEMNYIANVEEIISEGATPDIQETGITDASEETGVA